VSLFGVFYHAAVFDIPTTEGPSVDWLFYLLLLKMLRTSA
jgi:hypothetical protein